MDCFWCIKDKKTNAKALEKLCSTNITTEFLYDLQKDLTDCYDCVLAYHSAKQFFLLEHETTQKELLAWETDRLCDHFKSVLNSKLKEEEDATDVDDLLQEDTMPGTFGFGDGADLQVKLCIPLQEILNFPYLLWDKELAKLSTEALLSLEEAGSPLILDGKLPGIYLLLIHPSAQVRKWARKSVNFLGSVSCDDYDDLSDVVKWIMGVSEFGLFQCPELGDDPLTQSSYTILPSHLFVQYPVKEFWLGVCMFLKALEVTTVRLQLVSRGNHQAFIGVVVTALDHANSVDKKTAQGRQSEFWPILHCFVILLERLGSRIWQHVSLLDAQMEVFRLITRHPAYLDELKHWPGFYIEEPQTSGTSSCDDCEEKDGTTSSSQMVYSWDGRRRRSTDPPRSRTSTAQSSFSTNPRKGKRQTVVFAWFKPYLKSVVDFGEVGAEVVKAVLKYLHGLKAEFLLTSQGYDSTMAALVYCLDHLLKCSLQSVLSIASNLWIPDVIEILSLEPAKPSPAQKLANVFCKCLLGRIVKSGVNVTSLMKWFEDKNKKKDMNNSNSDYEMLRRLQTLLQKVFKGDPTSPPDTRNFPRERRMIVTPKPSRHASDTSKKHPRTSEERFSSTPIKQEYKFMMTSLSPTFDVLSKPKENVKNPKSSQHSVSQKTIKQSPSRKEKTILDYFNKSSLLDARVDLQKLKVTRKSDNEGNSSDVLVVDSSDDFSSDVCKKENNGDVKLKSQKLSLKIKRGKRKKTKRDDEGLVSSTENSCKKVPSKKFYEKATTTKNASSAGSSFLEDDRLLDDHSNDDFLETVCSQFETKPSPRASSAEHLDQRTTSKESVKLVTVKTERNETEGTTVKTEKYCIVISDDNLSDVDSHDVASLRGAVDKVDVKPGGLAVVKKEEPSDESWVFINDDSDWKVKVEADAEMDNIFKHIKIGKSDGSGFDSSSKPKIKIEENQAQVKLEKRSPPWSPAGEDKSKSRNLASGFRFSGDNDWSSIINVDDDDDDDLLMSCLPVRDSLDTMTCVEADLDELPDECDVMIMENDVKNDDVADDVQNDVDDDVKNDVDDDVINDDVGDDVIIVATTSGRSRKRKDILSVVLSSTDDEAEDYEVKVEELNSADEDWKVNAKGGDVKRHEPSSVPTIPEEGTTVDDRKIAVSDYLSPEVAKTNCFGAFLSKLKTVYKKTNSVDVVAKQEVPSDENTAAVDPSGEMVDVEMKDEGELEGEKTCDENVVVETADMAGDNYDELDMDISTEVGTPKEIEPCQTKLSDAGRNKTSIVDASVFKDSAKIGIVRPLERSESVRVPAKPLVARVNSYPGAVLGTDASSTGLVSRNLAERQRNAFLKETRSVETKPRHALTVEEFYAVVLKWDPNLLFKTPMKSPNIPNYGKVSRIFTSMDHYYQIFKPLLFLEVWAQAVREWKDKLNKTGCMEYDLVVDSVNHFVTNFQLIKCKRRIRVEGNQTEMFLQESVLVMIELKDDSNPVRTRLFASVDSVSRERCTGKPGDQGDGTREAGGQYFEFSITLRMLATARRPMVRETLRIIVVTPLVTFIRQWKGLMFLPRSLLARDILSPRVTYCGTTDLPTVKDPTNSINDASYNDSQRSAIERTSEAIRKPYPIPRICFIQGPPGTGKSHTIIGLIKKYLKNRAAELQSERENQLPGGSSNNTLSQSSARILLCAPSNAAVDVLVRRLIAEMKTSEGNLGSAKGKNCGSINLVRIGRFSSIHPQVHPFTLDVLSKTEIAKLSAGDVKEEEAVKTKLEDTRGKIDLLEKQCYSLRCCGYGMESQEVKKVKILNSEIDELVKKKKQIERQYGEIRARTRSRKRQETKIKKDILFSADVICSTLSGSGSNLLYNELLKSTRKHLPFGCVIVDEACQSCELDILIPLQFGSSKLILVGDPEQLRTTILSQKAQDLLFGQSLYERHYRLFRERAHRIGLSLHSTKDNPIQMLEVQYRMHPDIAAFPSNRVYQGRLRNAKSVTTRPSVCALRPYIVLNICNAKEQLSSNGSICNPVECNLVLEICLLLRKSLQEKHFGIITPYRAQLNLLERHLREKGMDKIEVNTVDGFQGREKEVIIMSCVRAHGQAKGIGFLADRQRMNVALTRARYSLVILLNVDSLVTNKDWKACIDDAHQRGLLYDVNSSKDLSLALLDETAKGLGPAARSRSLSDENPPKDALGEGCKTAGDKIIDMATNENEGLRASVHDPRKVRGGENDRRGVPPGGTAREKSDKGADVMAGAGNVKAATGISDGDYVTGTCTREGTFAREGTLTRENKDRVNVGAEQSDGTKDRSLEKAGDKSSMGRSDQCQSAEGVSTRDPRKRKHGSGAEVRSEVRGGLVTKRGASIQDEFRRDEKKRKIEKGLGSNSDAEREDWDQKRREAHDPIRQMDYGSRGKGARREESRSPNDGKMTSNEREGREQISTAFSKRNGKSREDERKCKNPSETGTNSSSTAFQRADTKYHKGEPPVWLQRRNEAKNDPKRSGSEHRPTDSDQIASVDRWAPIMSQTSDDFDFDFDEHEPEVGNLETNKISNYDEPAALGTSIPDPPSNGVVDGDVIDLVMKSGGTFLAQNNPYFNQLASHEKREKRARDVSTHLSRENTTQVASRKELPGNSPHPTPHEVSSRTASGFNKPTKSVRFQPPPQAHRTQVRENYANRNLDDVVERVNARHPTRPPPPLLDQNDGQALGVRRFHGGARQRIAHGVDRNQHLATRALLECRLKDSSGHNRNRRPPNNLDKIRKGWKKNRN